MDTFFGNLLHVRRCLSQGYAQCKALTNAFSVGTNMRESLRQLWPTMAYAYRILPARIWIDDGFTVHQVLSICFISRSFYTSMPAGVLY